MSDATKQAAQDAIAAHHTSYWFLSNDSIPYHSQLGLLHRALQHVDDHEAPAPVPQTPALVTHMGTCCRTHASTIVHVRQHLITIAAYCRLWL